MKLLRRPRTVKALAVVVLALLVVPVSAWAAKASPLACGRGEVA
jgi:hypothetical protein